MQYEVKNITTYITYDKFTLWEISSDDNYDSS